MADRLPPTSASPTAVTGNAYMDEIAELLGVLFNASDLPLAGVAGTANAVTATLAPALSVADIFADGMKFSITWAAANTGAVTLAINGSTPRAVVDRSGTALAAGALGAGLRTEIEFIGGSFRARSPLLVEGNTSAVSRYFWEFNASGTWVKPVGLSADTPVTVELWGGGGGGNSATGGGGGGGGGYATGILRLGAIAASVSVSVGAGGAIGAAGGNSSFGTLVTAYGGGAASYGGGGGGGTFGAGGNASGYTAGAGAVLGGGGGGIGTSATNVPAGAGYGATFPAGGGGGGGGATGNSSAPGNGGAAHYGGGGGGGRGVSGSPGTGGPSTAGGNGGDSDMAGSVPGGGGGRNAAGAAGRVRVWI